MPDLRSTALLVAAALWAQGAAADGPGPAKVAQHRCDPLAERLFLVAPSKPEAAPKSAAGRARAEAARQVAAWDLPRSRLVWNETCADRPDRPAGRLRIWANAATMVARGDRLSVAGMIDDRFAARLAAKLDRAPGISTVALTSPGGNIAEAIRAGALLRGRGLDTEVVGACLSACPLVFLGGRSRVILRGAGRLGFHQASWSSGTPVSAISPVQARMGGHVSRMGAAPLTVLGWMRAAAPGDMHFPERRALCAAGIATRPTCPGVAAAKR